jgi:hypothetical protein
MKTRARPPDHLKREFVDRRAHVPDAEPLLSPADIQRALGWTVVKEGAEVERK